MLTGSYNLWLVLSSLLISMFASYTALNMTGRVFEAKARAARWWLLGGSIAMGIGIWSMHFLGMLALNLPMHMAYDPVITVLSLLLAIGSSALALWIVCKDELSWLRLTVGALLMGAGICGMHYTGMAAMRMDPAVHYIPSLVLLSIAIAVLASGAALWMAFHLRQSSSRMRFRVIAAVLMGLAIAGMHYTGMAAAQFPAGSVSEHHAGALSSSGLAPLIILSALVALSAALVISMFDVRASSLASSLEHAEQELYFLAMHDGLTKLPNRTLFVDRLNQEIENAKRSQKPFSLLFIDLDGFKHINDARGHQVGDLLLVQVAQRIRSLVRGRDTVARLGGDEFVVIADVENRPHATILAEKLVAALRLPYVVTGFNCDVSASIGIAFYSGHIEQQALVRQADAAMYRAKAQGRNTYCFYEESMNDDAQKRLEVLHDLRLALAREELVLFYQPKLDARKGTMLGVEALIRWNHPARGILSPSEFIPAAEMGGLVLPIGEWTIKEACRQLSEWRRAGHAHWSVSVNLSTVQFNYPGLIELVSANLKRHALEPGSLIFEITESTAMRDPEMSLKTLQKLRQLGVKISIDDFGTGYSSLLYLKKLPASELKIDREFVRDLTESDEDVAIVSTIVALGEALNLEVVAEGVETKAQEQLLKNLGCTTLQGFLLGHPMRAEELVAAVERKRLVTGCEKGGRYHLPRLVSHIPSVA
jgi:diguanylate cyclase (GGDEF)-like protein